MKTACCFGQPARTALAQFPALTKLLFQPILFQDCSLLRTAIAIMCSLTLGKSGTNSKVQFKALGPWPGLQPNLRSPSPSCTCTGEKQSQLRSAAPNPQDTNPTSDQCGDHCHGCMHIVATGKKWSQLSNVTPTPQTTTPPLTKAKTNIAITHVLHWGKVKPAQKCCSSSLNPGYAPTKVEISRVWEKPQLAPGSVSHPYDTSTTFHQGAAGQGSHRIQLSHKSHQAHTDCIGMLPHNDVPSRVG